MTTDDLNLGDSWRLEWDAYTNVLGSLGLKLSGDPDVLLWSYNKSNGQVTTNLAYDFIDASTWVPNNCWHWSDLWKGNGPLKIK